MKVFKIHLPKYRKEAVQLWSLLHSGIVKEPRVSVLVNGNPVPSISKDIDGTLKLDWDGFSVTLHRNEGNDLLFDLCEGKSVPLGRGFSVRFPGDPAPYREIDGDAVVLSWPNPPAVSAPLLPEASIHKVVLREDSARIHVAFLNIEVTW